MILFLVGGFGFCSSRLPANGSGGDGYFLSFSADVPLKVASVRQPWARLGQAAVNCLSS
jgi:hypothetical protein